MYRLYVVVAKIGIHFRAFHIGILVVGGITLHRKHYEHHIALGIQTAYGRVIEPCGHLRGAHLLIAVFGYMLCRETKLRQPRPVDRRIVDMNLDNIAEHLTASAPYHRMMIHMHERIALRRA